jgi:hypothetical protein
MFAPRAMRRERQAPGGEGHGSGSRVSGRLGRAAFTAISARV